MKLKVISPEKELLNVEVQAVELPGAAGRFVVLTGHAPLISSLEEGTVRYDLQSGSRETLSVAGGFVKVKDDVVTVCVG